MAHLYYELAIRRLKAAQRMVESPGDSEAVVAAMFGRMECEGEKEIDQMQITQESTPWAIQLYKDLLLLDKARDGETKLAQDGIRAIFVDPVVRAAFVLADVSIIRQWFVTSSDVTEEQRDDSTDDEGHRRNGDAN